MRRSMMGIVTAAALAMIGAGCGGEDDGGGITPPTGTIEIKPGRWYVQASATTNNASCQTIANFLARGDSVTICGKANPKDFLEGLDCDFVVNGSTVTVACEGTVNYLGCNLAYEGNATGTFNSDRSLFTLAIPVQISTTNTEACGGSLSCQLTTTMRARWVNTGGCTSSPSVETAVAAFLAPLAGLGIPAEQP